MPVRYAEFINALYYDKVKEAMKKFPGEIEIRTVDIGRRGHHELRIAYFRTKRAQEFVGYPNYYMFVSCLSYPTPEEIEYVKKEILPKYGIVEKIEKVAPLRYLVYYKT